jgi:hypothetical protein
MATQLLNLPLNIPWKLIHQSPDMMDVQFCNKRFPFEWRSSLAISVFEPEDLPEDSCAGIITYVKVTCTITGYQPTKAETDQAYHHFLPPFGNVPTEGQLDDILRDYWACYGVLLNVAVFPYPRTLLERISIDFGSLGPGTDLPSPYQTEDASFEPTRPKRLASNRTVDIYPRGGDGKGELDLHQEMVVTLPSTSRVEAKVVNYAPRGTTRDYRGVTMEAYSGTQLIGSKSTGREQGQIHELAVDGLGIDRVVFRTPQGEASLLEFAYTREKPVDLKDFPHIIDFEPKTRDLYQAATQDAEILTGSASKVTTDKTFANTETTESGFDFGGKLTAGLGGDTGMLSAEVSGNYHHNTKDTSEDRTTIQTDASRDRREKNATTTNVTQMYNRLTGYDAGTNRPVFLMLPRLHDLQQDYRTFVQGVREIEGIQEFFLVVARPKEIEGLCIEASLDTGHFPENVPVVEPEVEYDERHEDFIVAAQSEVEKDRAIEEFVTSKYTIESGWVIDRRLVRNDGSDATRDRGDADVTRWDRDHPGIKDLEATQNDLSFDGTLLFRDGAGEAGVTNYNYQPISDATVQVSGRILKGFGAVGRFFKRRFRVFTRSEQPKRTSAVPHVGINSLLITNRCLCVCFKSGKCPEVVATPPCPPPPPVAGGGGETKIPGTVAIAVPPPPVSLPVSIVDERIIEIDPALLMREETAPTRLTSLKITEKDGAQTTEISPTLLGPKFTPRRRVSAMRQLVSGIQNAMITSGRLRTRLPVGEVGFVDTDYFKNRIKQVLPPTVLGIRLGNVSNLPEAVLTGFGRQATIADALVPDLASFARKTGLSVSDAANARRTLLTVQPPAVAVQSPVVGKKRPSARKGKQRQARKGKSRSARKQK